jgi:gluconate 2-dehydrogenase gamma chain
MAPQFLPHQGGGPGHSEPVSGGAAEVTRRGAGFTSISGQWCVLFVARVPDQIATSESDIWLSRRDLLRALVALIPTFTIAGCAHPSMPRRSTAQADPHRYFTLDEWAFLQAACSRLIPADENSPGAVELGVPEFIDRQMDGAFGHAATWYMQGPFSPAPPELGYQSPLTPREVYRAGIAAVDAHCRRTFGVKSFCDLPAATQDLVLIDLESGALEFENVSGKSFFDFLLQNTKEGYLADPIHGGNKNMESWKLIGFPGARADFIDWVDQHGVHYPLVAVGIAGNKG